MPCIQSKFRHAHNVLNGDGIVRGKTLLGDKVAVKLANQQNHNVPFHGFIDYSVFLKNRQWVKVVNIAAFTWDEDGLSDWSYLANHEYACGIFEAGGCKLVLENGQLMTRTFTFVKTSGLTASNSARIEDFRSK
jgi:hypothetical protein